MQNGTVQHRRASLVTFHLVFHGSCFCSARCVACLIHGWRLLKKTVVYYIIRGWLQNIGTEERTEHVVLLRRCKWKLQWKLRVFLERRRPCPAEASFLLIPSEFQMIGICILILLHSLGIFRSNRVFLSLKRVSKV